MAAAKGLEMTQEKPIVLYTSDRPSDRKVKEGELIWVSTVNAANIFRDVREMITNVLGGEMRRYERVMDVTLERALTALKDKAREKGYDGCLAVRISHPRIAAGACEIFVYGTAFHFVDG
jgi:uncharacterized protein YbjQ (UPF0145 family)